MPTPAAIAHADQLHAASVEARRTLARLGPAATITLTESPWLAEQIAALHRGLTNGHGRACPHLGPAPRVAHAAVWAPGILTCPACVAQLRPATAVEDATCDRCRRVVTRIHSAAAALGPVLLTYGLCPPCLTAANLNPRKDTHQ
jgi:hypothetical protein